MRLLIIDDEIDYCTLLKMFFIRRGIDVTICHLLEEGMHTLSIADFDCLILDNNLPDGMGWDRATEISAHYPNTILVLISAYPRRFNVELPKGAKVYQKPVSYADLQQLILPD